MKTKKRLKIFVIIMVFVLSFFLFPIHAKANDLYELTINYENETEFDIYQVAVVDAYGNIINNEQYKNCVIKYDDVQNTIKELTHFVKDKNNLIDLTLKKENNEYKANLEKGVYLIVGKKYEKDNISYTILPALISINKDMTITPKQDKEQIIVDSDSNDTPTITPTVPPEENIPQTGFEFYPIIYVFVAGYVLLLLAFVFKKNKILFSMSILAFVVGIGMIGYIKSEEQKSNHLAVEKSNVLVQEIQKRQENPNSDEKEEIRIDDNPEFNEGESEIIFLEDLEMDTIEIDGLQYIGYINIPSREIRLPIISDYELSYLKTSPAKYKGSVFTNDMIIAGHNYEYHFGKIRDMEIGDTLNFVDVNNNVYNYEINDIEILNTNQLDELLENNNEWDLTLFTCTQGGKSRVVLRCSKIYI